MRRKNLKPKENMPYTLWITFILAQAPANDELLKKIEESLAKRQQEVRTLYCEATVDSIFAKGMFTHDKKQNSKKLAELKDNPAEDVSTKNEQKFWKYDFAKQNFQITVSMTQPGSDTTKGIDYLFKDHLVSSSVDGVERTIRKKEKSELSEINAGRPPVEIFDTAIHHFSIEDAFLLWRTGRTKMDGRSENFDKLYLSRDFYIDGKEKINGQVCAVMCYKGVEKSPNKINFYVDPVEPYALRRIEMVEKSSKKKFWDVDAEYDSEKAPLIPKRIISRNFSQANGSLQTSHDFRIVSYVPNKEFDAKDFDDTAMPGMIAQKRGVKGLFEADSNGELRPYRPESRNSRRWIAWLLLGAIGTGMAYRMIRRTKGKRSSSFQK